MKETRSISGKTKLRIFLHLLIVLHFSIADFQARAQVSTYYRTYNMGGMQGGLGTLNMPDGGFVGTGQHEGNGSAGDCDVYAYRVDACGNILWMKLIGSGGQEGAKSISLRNNGNILLTGLYSNTGLLMELDPAGNLVWEKRYSGVTWTLASTENSSGEIFVTCTYPGAYAIMKCDNSGNILWSRIAGGLGELPLSIICHNNEVYVTSTANTPGGDFSLAKFDGQGNLTWANIYGGTGFGDADHSTWGNKAIYDSTDNTIMVVNQTVINGSEDIMVVKIETLAGNIVWSRVIGSPAGSEQPRDITRTAAGYAIIGNTNSFPSGVSAVNSENMAERDVLLLNLDVHGNLLWARTYGGAERDKGIGLRYNPGVGFLMSAYTSSPVFGNNDQSMDPLFIKADTAGFVSCQTYSPAVPSQAATINRIPAGSVSPTNITAAPSNSVVSNLLPSDHYICLNCFTVPIFVPSDTTVCAGDTVYFYNTTSVGFTCYQEWSINGDVFNGGIDTLNYVFNDPGTYPILLYSNCGGQTDTFIVNITVYPLPEADFSVTSNCLEDAANFTNLSTITSGTIGSYQWDFGDNTTSATVSPVHIYQSTGQFTVTLQATSNHSCSSGITHTVDIFPNPAGTFTATKACAGGTIQLEYQQVPGGGTITGWIWNDGYSSAWSTGSTIFQTSFPIAGSYNSTLVIINDRGCDDTITKPVVVYNRPTAAFSASDVCFNEPAVLTNLSVSDPGVTPYYTWLWGDGSIGLQMPTPHVYSSTGTYTVKLIAADSLLSGCIDSTESLIIVHPLPVPLFPDVPPDCEPYAFRLQDSSYIANGTISKWNWNLGNGITSSVREPLVVYADDGDYVITLSVISSEGCISDPSYSSTVTVYPKPIADFTYSPAEPTIYFPEVYFSERCIGGIEVLWNFPDNITYTEPDLFHSFQRPGRYLVSLITTSDKGCKDTTAKEVIVKDDFSFYLPNAFSPNNDGMNETYSAVSYNISSYQMEIFDRWGEKVFTTSEPGHGWDGTVQGNGSPQGIYVYKVTYLSKTGTSGYLTGKFSLIR